MMGQDSLGTLVRIIEERMGPVGRPFTTAIVVVSGCAVIAWGLGVIYNKLVAPIGSFLGVDVGRDTVTSIVSVASLALVLGALVALLGHLQGRGKDAKIRELQAEVQVLRGEGENG